MPSVSRRSRTATIEQDQACRFFPATALVELLHGFLAIPLTRLRH